MALDFSNAICISKKSTKGIITGDIFKLSKEIKSASATELMPKIEDWKQKCCSLFTKSEGSYPRAKKLSSRV